MALERKKAQEECGSRVMVEGVFVHLRVKGTQVYTSSRVADYNGAAEYDGT